ncbi:unnamed protein product [Vicia faba]|uniref:non-specific serine/threonine protein kinase n=1 Tax=Vicia faba TaxID=3906 RepID=A0AAV1A6B3_VICFA|nr:unnamed protein product [Vicia faba]
MNHFSFFFIFFYVYFCYLPNKTLAMTLTLQNQTDHQALLQFKHSITNYPNGVLDSWNSSTHFCKWHGITCNPMHQRVTKLNLQGNNLYGSISPFIGNLSRLRNINLQNNSFTKKIPHELGQLLKLNQLSLGNNMFLGDIPKSLSNCSNLKVLHLLKNNLTGNIPIEFASLQKLLKINIGKNHLTGGVPSFMSNLSSLTSLVLFFNNLEGNIPQEICLLRNLRNISVDVNKLSGTFPPCFYNMSSLESISFAENRFNGYLPWNMFYTLPYLKDFRMGHNLFSGKIPTSIANASTLKTFDIGQNSLRGQVPSLGKLRDLDLLNLEINILGSNSTKDLDFLKTLTNCTKLRILSITANSFGGFLPNSIGNFSHHLYELYLGGNEISGEVPKGLGNLANLIILSLGHNHFEGTIPTSFGQFKKMQLLDLRQNNFSGEIPSFIGNLSQLFDLRMEENMFEGNIPLSIGKCQMLQFLSLSHNNLRGPIPLEVFRIPSLAKLDVSENRLSGEIPRTIYGCLSLKYLGLQGNSLNGTIPSKLSDLKSLQYLDLSRNQLSGSIPNDLENMDLLEYLNVSFNKLEGEVPIKGVFQNASRIAVTGNNKLCGGILELHLSPCPANLIKPTKHQNLKLAAVIISVIVFLILMLALTIYLMRKRNRKSSFDTPRIEQLDKVSYQELYQGTDGFSDRNLIGSGSFGSVYKGNLASQDKVVAIKVLNLKKKGAHKSFIAECNALKNIRHRNLVKVLTCCSSTDYKGEEFKALVFDYMKNGSLEDWLHPRSANSEHQRMLSLVQRLNIMIDIAYALHYLHRECEQLVLHCDIKPSNILLDDDMVARVSDFGITKLVSVVDDTSYKETSTVRLKGTIGYAPPEYGMSSEVSSYGDMYSFGILVLEMIIGRRPTDEMFEDGENLHTFVKNSFHGSIMQILDTNLVVPRDTEARVEKCLVSVLRIGIACSMESPKERMNIVDVTKELDIIKMVFLDGERRED